MTIKKDYVLEYCQAVQSEKIVTGKKIKLAVERELNDRERSKTENFNYYFDSKMATKAIKFMELIPNPSGGNLQLALFQKFLIGSLYGWREKETNNRRFSNAFISIARKNGKSMLASAIGNATLLLEDKPQRGRQILFVANTLSQAMLSFNMARHELNRVIQVSPTLRNRLSIKKQEIDDLETDSFMKPLPADADHLDGYNATLAVIDEYHASKDHSIINVLKSGMGQQKNGLLCIISTSGFNLKGAMHEDYEALTEVLEGKTNSDRQFIAIYEQDSKDDIYKPELWEASNPIFEISEIRQTMASKIQNDIDTATQTGDLVPVLVKNFNRWEQTSNESYISSEDWKNAITEDINIRDQDVYIGVDLSKSSDLTAVSWLIPLDDGRFYVNSHAFVGTKYGLEKKIREDGINYSTLAKRGECSITRLDSGVIDYDEVFNYIVELVEGNNLHVLGVCYDPWSFDYLLPEFERKEYPLIEVRQGTKTLGIPTKRFKEELFKGNIIHPDNKLLEYNVNNAILKYDANNNPIINKAKHANRIDEIAALMNAYTVGMDYHNKIEGAKKTNEYFKNEFSF